MILEVCVDSYESFLEAKRAGADRIELCAALEVDGLTPSYGLMKQAAQEKQMEVFVMIRPRSGDFLYHDLEFEEMKNNIRIVKEMGFQGIVIGFLNEDGSLDLNRLKQACELAAPMKVVLHRAFDQAVEPENQIQELIEMGVCRILTSGQKKTALEGALYIKKIQEKYGNQITIMPGSGVNATNIPALYEQTSCTQYHLSGKSPVKSSMKRVSPDLEEQWMEKADYEKIHAVRKMLDTIKTK